MENPRASAASVDLRAVRYLTYLMFFMFAMTTDSVGLIIQQVIAEFGLSLKKAGALHYGSMAGIAGAGLFLGFLADRIGRKRSILLGLALFGTASCVVPLTHTFAAVLVLITLSGVAIGLFKSAALALVADISSSTNELTSTMNMVEGFFGIGSIVGPAVLSLLLERGVSWRWLYAFAGALCLLLIVIAAKARYPADAQTIGAPRNMRSTVRLLTNPYALGFSAAAFAYVAVECAIYVWMPTLLADYHGRWQALAVAALPTFFVLRALGRFIGAWLLRHFDWTRAIAICSGAILLCFFGAISLGLGSALVLLPLSGLFMSIIYPTINSKGIGCFPTTEQGAAAGVLLFFTCAGAVAGPLAMAIVGDAFSGAYSSFVLATVLAALLALGLAINATIQPARDQLARFTTQPTISS